MKRGANTIPFHNLLPYSESNEGLFLFFSPSLNWIKEKSVATLAIHTFAIQKSQSQFTVLHPQGQVPNSTTSSPQGDSSGAALNKGSSTAAPTIGTIEV